MTTRRDRFYHERDRRTRQYGGTDEALERPILIAVGADIATTRAGQIAVLALVNMTARVHRTIGLLIPAVPLIAQSLIAADDLRSAAIATARAINPVIDLIIEPMDTSSFRAGVGIGIGLSITHSAQLGWYGGLGTLTTSEYEPVTHRRGSVFGPAAAAVLGAAALFRLVHDEPINSARFNPIERTTDAKSGTRDHTGPIDVGDVLTIGAGAVAAALFYWLRELHTRGQWDIVDADIAELHNTNRCLTMTSEHAGWPNGAPTTAAITKAESAAVAIGARPYNRWYDQWQTTHQDRHDLVLVLANGRNVRTLITQRGEPLLLHATTSSNWTAELHRHRPELDDCPSCRIPDTAIPQLACSTGPATPDRPDSPDAALPFLSAGAGLLLAAALADLPEGALLTEHCNHWPIDLTLTGTLMQRPWFHPLRQGCTHIQPARIRAAYQQHQPRRWDYLDQLPY